jgi:hypothetical protein
MLWAQARLERLWEVLELPLIQRLDSVLVFTNQERACHFEHALLVSLIHSA